MAVLAEKRLLADLEGLNSPGRETLQERVYQELKRAMMQGRFAPGSALPLRSVAAAMGTSLMPVREALRQLAAERAVEVLPNRAFAIPKMTRAILADLGRTRLLIEGEAARLAALRQGPRIADQLIALRDKITEATGAHDRAAYRSYNQEFHFCIYSAAGSPVMLHVIETLWLQAGPYLNLSFSDASGSPIVSQIRHEEAIEAMQKGDGEAARDAIMADISDAMEWIMPQLE